LNSDIYRQLEQLFHQALELPEEERAAFIRQACGDNVDLLEKLTAMLEFAGNSEDSILDKPQTAPIPENIGPYKILHLLGEGGFSLVYLAQQEEPLRRKIALKVLKPGLDTHAILARFSAERQALAVMNHDGIARIFDAGATAQGRPFFAMEYVPGLPITEYCDRHQLCTRRRLELFTAVCNAVHHAHQKGVIHRDLKPGNILVAERDGRPQVKVIDFGIAKATAAHQEDQTMFTLHGQVIGTPEYMSPEQAGSGPGDVDTRTDIYSLGVVLYELLAGVPPFSRETLREAGFAEVQRIIREVDPPRPSTRVSALGDDSATVALQHQTATKTLIRQLQRELDWVVLKAMEKDRERRYESPFALGADILRYLEDQPLEARPPSRFYRLKKFSRRNKLGITVALALGLGLVGVATGVTVALVQSNKQRTVIEKSLADVQQARDESQAVTDFLGDMLGAVRPYNLGRDATVRAVLDSTMQNLDADLGDRPLIATQVRRTIGGAYADLGLIEKAEPVLLRAYEDHLRLLGPDHPQTLLSMDAVCDILMLQDRNEEAEKLYSELQLNYERLLGAGHIRTLAAMHQRGSALVELSRYDEAETLLVRSWRGAQTAVGHETQMYLSFASNLANFYAESGRPDEAAPLLNRVLEVVLKTRGEEHPAVMETWNNIAMLYADQGRFQECIEPLTHAHLLQDKLMGPQHYEALLIRNNLAAISGLLFRWAYAESLYATGVDLVRTYHEPSERITQHMINNLGYLAMRQGQLDRAEVLLREAYDLRLEYHGQRSRDTMVSENNLGELAMHRGDYSRAENMHRRNMALRSEILGPEHQHTLASMVNLGRVLELEGKSTEADSVLTSAYEMARRTLPEGHRATIAAACYWGRLRLAMGQFDEVELVMAPMLAVADSALVQNDPLRGAVRVQLSSCALQGGRLDEAGRFLGEADALLPVSLTRVTPWRQDYLTVRKKFEEES